MHPFKTRFHVAALLLGFLLLSACASPSASPAPTPSPTIFQLIKPDGSTVDFTLDDLKQLPFTAILAEGSPEEGPALLDVLSAAGVTDFIERQNVLWFLAFVGGLAHMTKPLMRLMINELTGWPYGSLLLGVVYPVATYFVFGAIGAFIGAGLIWWLKRRR